MSNNNYKLPLDMIDPDTASVKYVNDQFQSNLLNYTTNRILEIPQDIKLELNNGTLTLKAGSKVYVPNGFEADGTTPKFDVVTVQNDTSTNWKYNSKYVVYFDFVNNIVSLREPSFVYSGSTQPSGNQDIVWYDTGNNLIKTTHDYGSTWENNASFPVAIATDTASNGFTSIDQVFNGFGYIGSTVFALPGVKGQIPNRRNEDGTCKATLTTLTSVKTHTFTDAARRGWYLQPNGASSGNSPVYSDTQPSQNYIRWFSSKDNQWYDTHSSPELNSETYILPLAVFNTDSTGKITSFEPYTVDSVANSNASNFSQAGRSYLSGLGMPSNRYIDLTVLASGSTYTAPANGWFSAYCATGSSTSCYLLNNTNGINANGVVIERLTDGRCYIPVKKGDIISFYYNGINASLGAFRFIYAEGEN